MPDDRRDMKIVQLSADLGQAHKSLQEEIQRLVKEQTQLRTRNAELESENSHLKQELGQLRSVGAGLVAEHKQTFELDWHVVNHNSPAHSVAVSPDSNYCASASWDGFVNVYNFSSPRPSPDKKDFRPEKKLCALAESSQQPGFYSVAFAKTFPNILGCTSADKNIYLWNHKDNELLKQMGNYTMPGKGHEDEVNGIDFHSSQNVLVSAGDDQQAIIWDFQEGIMLRQLKSPHTAAVYGATFLGSALEYYVATCCFDKKTRIFDMRSKTVTCELEGHKDDIIGLDFSGQTQMLATGSDDGTVHVWDMQQLGGNKRLHDLNLKMITRKDDVEVKRVSFSRDGDMIAAACSSGQVVVFHGLKTGNVTHDILDQFNDCVFDVSWGVDNTNSPLLVAASHDKSVACWKVR
eukprot:CAMPEP_0197626604 /NCGR_PEP_ID=MMETSP1338-20131121/5492_1 /TAXON_ID=43686 ORGANISM="Pelagodinium beii, Strain RCC1491" /NCGR_SAMPLE_ID=MMETSP1338 /ASSEMBLY_ACC=CAM_ASM_000754 /LENGTH=405 /DNA_ID=CAMNT_0043197147 /DNA_START=24 /DNA_END=1241 /DNA_ORIENTATION=+